MALRHAPRESEISKRLVAEDLSLLVAQAEDSEDVRSVIELALGCNAVVSFPKSPPEALALRVLKNGEARWVLKSEAPLAGLAFGLGALLGLENGGLGEAGEFGGIGDVVLEGIGGVEDVLDKVGIGNGYLFGDLGNTGFLVWREVGAVVDEVEADFVDKTLLGIIKR